MKKWDTKSFITYCSNIWGEEFTYDKTVYRSTKHKLIVTSVEGIDYLVSPLYFRNRQYPLITSAIDPTHAFTTISNSIHNNVYDYSKVKYINCNYIL